MPSPDLKSIYSKNYSILKKAIEQKANIDLISLEELEKDFKANPELLFYSPAHDMMSQVNYTRLEVDSMAYLILNHAKWLGYKGEEIPEGFTSFLSTAIPHALKNKSVFDNFLAFFLGKENRLVSDHSRHHVQETNLDAYMHLANRLMLSEHFKQSHMEEIFLSTLAKRKAYDKEHHLQHLFQEHDHGAHALFMRELGIRFNNNDKTKALLSALLLNPINEKLIKKNASASLLIFLSQTLSPERLKKAALNLITEVSPHINRLDGSGKTFYYYILKHGYKEKDYISSVLQDFGAISVSPSITNKFIETVMSFCKSFTPARPHTPTQSNNGTDISPSPISQQNVTSSELIKKLDFSKFTSSEKEMTDLKARLQTVCSAGEQILASPEAKALEFNDVFFIKKDILEVFLVSTFDLTKSLSSFSLISPLDTKSIFEPWLEQLGIIETRLNNISQKLKDNLIVQHTNAAQVNLKVLKAKN